MSGIPTPKVKNGIKIPAQIELLYDYIEGSITCTKCGAEIVDYYHQFGNKTYWYVDHEIQKHKCNHKEIITTNNHEESKEWLPELFR